MTCLEQGPNCTNAFHWNHASVQEQCLAAPLSYELKDSLDLGSLAYLTHGRLVQSVCGRVAFVIRPGRSIHMSDHKGPTSAFIRVSCGAARAENQ